MRVISPTVGDTRTEEDFVKHIRATIATAPSKRWIFIAAQLNTHKSESLVKAVNGLGRTTEIVKIILVVQPKCALIWDYLGLPETKKPRYSRPLMDD